MSPPTQYYRGEAVNGDDDAASRSLLPQLYQEEGDDSGAYGKIEPRKGTHFW